MSKKVIFSIFISLFIIVVGSGIISVRLNRQLYIDVLKATDDKELVKVENDEWDLEYMQSTLDKVKSVDYDLDDVLSGNIDLSTYEYVNDSCECMNDAGVRDIADGSVLVNLANEPEFKVLYCGDPFEIRLDFPEQTIVFSEEIFTSAFSKVRNIDVVETFKDIFLAISN